MHHQRTITLNFPIIHLQYSTTACVSRSAESPESSRESQWENHAVVLPLIVSPVLRIGETAAH